MERNNAAAVSRLVRPRATRSATARSVGVRPSPAGARPPTRASSAAARSAHAPRPVARRPPCAPSSDSRAARRSRSRRWTPPSASAVRAASNGRSRWPCRACVARSRSRAAGVVAARRIDQGAELVRDGGVGLAVRARRQRARTYPGPPRLRPCDRRGSKPRPRSASQGISPGSATPARTRTCVIGSSSPTDSSGRPAREGRVPERPQRALAAPGNGSLRVGRIEADAHGEIQGPCRVRAGAVVIAPPSRQDGPFAEQRGDRRAVPGLRRRGRAPRRCARSPASQRPACSSTRASRLRIDGSSASSPLAVACSASPSNAARAHPDRRRRSDNTHGRIPDVAWPEAGRDDGSRARPASIVAAHGSTGQALGERLGRETLGQRHHDRRPARAARRRNAHAGALPRSRRTSISPHASPSSIPPRSAIVVARLGQRLVRPSILDAMSSANEWSRARRASSSARSRPGPVASNRASSRSAARVVSPAANARRSRQGRVDGARRCRREA